MENLLYYLLVLGGLGQIVLCIGSIKIPAVLNWKQELAPLNPLTRQMFWVYSLYIWSTNLAFGLLSFFAPQFLLQPSGLSAVVSAFICLYWGARVLIQLFYFDRSSAPQGKIYLLAEIALESLFIYLTLVYGTLAYLAWSVL